MGVGINIDVHGFAIDHSPEGVSTHVYTSPNPWGSQAEGSSICLVLEELGATQKLARNSLGISKEFWRGNPKCFGETESVSEKIRKASGILERPPASKEATRIFRSLRKDV